MVLSTLTHHDCYSTDPRRDQRPHCWDNQVPSWLVHVSVPDLLGELANDSNNEWVLPSKGETFSTVNPANGEKIADIAHASAEDVDAAVKAARTAFNTEWGTHVDSGIRVTRE